MRLTCLPPRVSQALRVRKPCFRHHLVLCWLLVLYILYGQRANLQALARYGPAHLAYQHYRRLLCAAYWCTKALRWWFAHQAMQALPPPQDGLLYLVVTAPSRASAGTSILWTPASAGILPPGFGFRVVFLMAQGGVYGAGVDVVLLCRKDDPGYQKCPVSADAAGFSPAFLMPRRDRGGRGRLCAARDTLKRLQKLDGWYCPAAYLEAGQRQAPQGPGAAFAALPTGRRRPFWVFSERTPLRHLGKARRAYRPRAERTSRAS